MEDPHYTVQADTLSVAHGQESSLLDRFVRGSVRLRGALVLTLAAAGLVGCDAQADAPCYGDVSVAYEIPSENCIEQVVADGDHKDPEKAVKARFVDNVRADQASGSNTSKPLIFETRNGRKVFAGLLTGGSAELVTAEESAISRFCLIDPSKPAELRDASLRRDVSSKMFLEKIGIHWSKVTNETCHSATLPGVLPEIRGSRPTVADRSTTTSSSTTTSTVTSTTTPSLARPTTSATTIPPRPSTTRASVVITVPPTTRTESSTTSTIQIVTPPPKEVPVFTLPPGHTVPR